MAFGASAVGPFSTRAMATPRQLMVERVSGSPRIRLSSPSSAWASSSALFLISSDSTLSAAARKILLSSPKADASSLNWNPSRVPIKWPSTYILPSVSILAIKLPFRRNSLIRTDIRRSTKRCVRLSCSASDSLSSISLVNSCQYFASSNQVARWEI